MFFDDYRQHKNATIRPSLLWEYELADFNWNEMRNIVIQRVIERGRLADFYAVINLYGIEKFKDAIKDIPVMNKKDIAFVCIVFGLKIEQLKCYTQKQLHQQHWIS